MVGVQNLGYFSYFILSIKAAACNPFCKVLSAALINIISKYSRQSQASKHSAKVFTLCNTQPFLSPLVLLGTSHPKTGRLEQGFCLSNRHGTDNGIRAKDEPLDRQRIWIKLHLLTLPQYTRPDLKCRNCHWVTLPSLPLRYFLGQW